MPACARIWQQTKLELVGYAEINLPAHGGCSTGTVLAKVSDGHVAQRFVFTDNVSSDEDVVMVATFGDNSGNTHGEAVSVRNFFTVVLDRNNSLFGLEASKD